MTQRTLDASIPDIDRVLSAWSNPDDWNVYTIHASTAIDLISALASGVSAERLAAHASHDAATYGSNCCPDVKAALLRTKGIDPSSVDTSLL